jgi:hypothetical protein
MRPYLYNYRDKFLVGVDYGSKNVSSIVQWKIDVARSATPKTYNREVYNNTEGLLDSITKGAGQDSVNLMAMYCLGLARMSPCRSKAEYIGMNGQNYNPRIWKQLGMDKQKNILHKTEGEFTYIGEI